MYTDFTPAVLVSENDKLQTNTKRIYLVRHGHSGGTDKNALINPPLTEKGIKQAKLLSTYFEEKEIDEIITSELTRAIETAEIIKGIRNVEIKKFNELNELHSIVEGAALSQEAYFRVINSRIYKHDEQIKGGETLQDLHKRVESIWEKVIVNSTSNNILIITHFEVMRVFISIIFKITHDTDIDFLIAFPHTSVSELRIVNTVKDSDLPERMFVLQYLCKTDHLKNENGLISY